MKNREANRKTDYSEIKRKLYSYVFIAVIAAVAFVAFVRLYILHRVAGEFIVNLLTKRFHIEYQDAMRIYQYTIRNNMDILIYIAVAFCFFFLCRFILSRFMKYFDEVNAGIDSLIKGKDTQIELSSEMAFMEQKLNTLKQTLYKREQDAKLSEQRKNDLVMYLAHDIKTPLTSVIGYLSLLDEVTDMPAPQRAKYVHITLDKAYRLEQLIDEFFEITRYNLQTITLSKESIDLCYMLVQMADEFYPQLADNGKQAIGVNVPEDLAIYGDPDKLARVFNNILKNAVVYSGKSGAISISASISGDTAYIVFTNEGSIPKDKLTEVFDKFYRLDSARSSGSGGAGLGLAIAKEIVLAHGGNIYAESDGKETSFTVELPVI